MKRFWMTASVAALGLALLAVTSARADGRPGSGSGRHETRSSHGSFREFHASTRFDYGRHGFRSFSWSYSRWSSYYHRYCYWSPRFHCWCFYEPSYRYYVPVSYFREVYPEFTPTVSSSPSVIQQTTVVVTKPSSVGDEPPPIPTAVVPAPTAVQNTKVGPGVPPIPTPVASAPTAVQKTKVGPGVP